MLVRQRSLENSLEKMIQSALSPPERGLAVRTAGGLT